MSRYSAWYALPSYAIRTIYLLLFLPIFEGENNTIVELTMQHISWDEASYLCAFHDSIITGEPLVVQIHVLFAQIISSYTYLLILILKQSLGRLYSNVNSWKNTDLKYA